MAQKGSNIWDVIGKAGEGALKAAVANKNAQNTLKSQLMLYKIKNLFEQQGAEAKAKTKFGYDVALEDIKAEAPFKAATKFSQNQGALPPNTRMNMGTGKLERVTLRNRLDEIVMKPMEQWDANDKMVIKQYQDFVKQNRKSSGGLAALFDEPNTENANPELNDLFKGL